MYACGVLVRACVCVCVTTYSLKLSPDQFPIGHPTQNISSTFTNYYLAQLTVKLYILTLSSPAMISPSNSMDSSNRSSLLKSIFMSQLTMGVVSCSNLTYCCT